MWVYSHYAFGEKTFWLLKKVPVVDNVVNNHTALNELSSITQLCTLINSRNLLSAASAVGAAYSTPRFKRAEPSEEFKKVAGNGCRRSLYRSNEEIRAS